MGTQRRARASTLTSASGDEDGAKVVGSASSSGMGKRVAAIAHGAALSAAMDRYIRGENDDFRTVYQLLAPRLKGLLLARGCCPAAADDILQQAFLRMHRARGRYKSGRDVTPWVVAIMRRLLVDQWRRNRRERLGDPCLENTCAASTPESCAMAVEAASRLTQTFLALPTTQQRAFELVRLHGLSIAETAESLGTTATSVKLRLHRADHALHDAVSRGESARGLRALAEPTGRAAEKSDSSAFMSQKLS